MIKPKSGEYVNSMKIGVISIQQHRGGYLSTRTSSSSLFQTTNPAHSQRYFHHSIIIVTFEADWTEAKDDAAVQLPIGAPPGATEASSSQSQGTAASHSLPGR